MLQQRPFGNLVPPIELTPGRERPRCPEKNLLVSASYDPRLHVKAEVDVVFHVGQKKRSLFGQKIVLQQRPFGNLVPPIELGSGRKWLMCPTIPHCMCMMDLKGKIFALLVSPVWRSTSHSSLAMIGHSKGKLL